MIEASVYFYFQYDSFHSDFFYRHLKFRTTRVLLHLSAARKKLISPTTYYNNISMSSVIIPGDSLPVELESGQVIIGPGIYKYPKTQQIIPQQAGLLNVSHPNKKSSDQLLYIESNSKRYIPQVNDFVIGIITGVFGEFFKVSLQEFSSQVQLSMMAFPNATKKNRPNLKVGQAVYARVSEAVAEVDTEIECVDAETGKEGGFGLLDESGYIFEINLNFARELLFNKKCVFLEKLAARCAFEIAIGINGKVWIKCGRGLTFEAPVKTEDGEDDEMDVDSATVTLRDMKMTLAAARYLMACQNVTTDKADEELKKAFKGTQ